MEYKKVLFICPPFFEYPKLIKNGIEKIGFKVDYFPSIPINRFVKMLYQFKVLKSKIKDLYYIRISNVLNDEYNYIFIIKGDEIPLWFMNKIKIEYKNSVFIQYNWDDIDFYPEIINRFSYFDKIYSYSINDSEKYNLTFRPFFFTRIDDFVNNNSAKKEIDIYIIASYNKLRYNFFPKFIKLNSHLIVKKFLYINPLMFIKERLCLCNLKMFKYYKKSYKKMLNEISLSKAILEVPYDNQEGLTTRSFESLFLGCKVITTNKNIVKYDFYRKSNVLIIDEDNFYIDKEWLESKFEVYDNELIDKYTLNKWILEVFDLNEC